ncbi:hypothetical protein AB733_01145 [Photobacterium swingsii]|nr:DUF1194 domain-containing protein [Photobacterium swingsii]KMV32178.1 hypothetical protein AB733_01145 [Photobacterium swingsii]
MLKLKTAALAIGLMLTAQAQATTLELALVLDGSGSINSSEYQLQLQGYKNVIASGTFYDDFIAPSIYDNVYLSAWQFSNTVIEEISWTNITSNAVATTFGNKFNTTEMNQIQSVTNTSLAIDTAVTSLLNNMIDSDKMIIDISTDGQPCCSSSSEADALASADAARDQNVTINAIGVGNGINATFLTQLVGINPADTPTGFFLQASNFTEFGDTIKTKLTREIVGPQSVPEPSSIAFIGLGALGLGALRRRKLQTKAQ